MNLCIVCSLDLETILVYISLKSQENGPKNRNIFHSQKFNEIKHLINLMLFSFFFFLSFSQKPIIIVPPLYGTNLYVTYQNFTELPFYCPQSITNKVFWLDNKYMVPPLSVCLFKILAMKINNETNELEDADNVSLTIHDFGGDFSVEYSDTGISSYHFMESCASILKYFQKKGYAILRDLFAAPYDWRKGTFKQDEYWFSFKSLIERAFRTNKKQKVVLIGTSMGCSLLNTFLTDHVDSQWKDQYIEKAVYIAPTFGGIATSFQALWENKLWGFNIIRNQDLEKMIGSFPFIHETLPNHEIFGDDSIIKSNYDVDYNASQVTQLLIDAGRLKNDTFKIHQMTRNTTMKAPQDPGVPSVILYNSAISTDFQYYFKNGFSKPPIIIKKPGDGVSYAKGTEYVCTHWNSPITCIDIFRSSDAFSHNAFINNPYVIELANSVTPKNGRLIQRAPYIDMSNNNSYQIREDIRSAKTILSHLYE